MQTLTVRRLAWGLAIGIHAMLFWPAHSLVTGGTAHAKGRAGTPPVSAVRVRWMASPSSEHQAERVQEKARSSSPIPEAEPRAAAAGISEVDNAPPGTQDDTDAYTAADLLDQRPLAIDAIMLPSPEGLDTGRWEARLSLFIDERGFVRRVRTESGDALPPPLAEATRQAFLAARFTPGQRGGDPVKARLLVEVQYVVDEAPRTAGSPVAAGAW